MTRQSSDFSSILMSELTKLLRAEIVSGLGGFFDNAVQASRQLPGPAGNLMPISIVINNNTPATVTARETSGAQDQRQLEITIDQMVADSLMRGNRTTGVLRTLFGLAPGLIGR